MWGFSRWFILLLAAVLLGIGFIHPWFWWCVIPALLLDLQLLATVTSIKRAAMEQWLLGSLKSFIVLSWMIYLYPLEWIPHSATLLSTLLLVTYWLAAAVCMGVGLVCLGIITTTLKRHTSYWIICVPIGWLAAEIIGAVAYSLLTLGPEGTLTSNFSYGAVGYLLIASGGFKWIAASVGLYGLSIILVTTAVCLFLLLHAYRKPNRFTYPVVACGGICLSLIAFWPASSAEPIDKTVISIDTYVSSEFKDWVNNGSLRPTVIFPAVEAALTYSPDYIILPEDARWTRNFKTKTNALQYLENHNNSPVILIDSSPTTTIASSSLYVAATTYNTATQSSYEQYKRYLAPHGEYIPYASQFLVNLLFTPEEIAQTNRHFAYIPGPLVEREQYYPDVLFCMENAVPYASAPDSPFVAHPISHTRFHNPTILWYQQDLMLQLQALTSGRPVISATNMAHSRLYGPDGTIQEGTLLEADPLWKLWQYQI